MCVAYGHRDLLDYHMYTLMVTERDREQGESEGGRERGQTLAYTHSD